MEAVWHRFDTSDPQGKGIEFKPRTGHTIVSHGSSVLVFGGTDGRRCQQHHAFRLDSEPDKGRILQLTGTWTHIEVCGEVNTLERRLSASTLCGCGRHIYHFGGHMGPSAPPQNDLISFDLTNAYVHTVSQEGHVPAPRIGHSLVQHNGRLYVFGGHDGHVRFDAVHYADTAGACLGGGVRWLVDEHAELSAFPQPRHGHTAVVHDEIGDSSAGAMVVFGGWTGSKTSNELWVWSFKTHQWVEVRPLGSQPRPRYRHSAVRVHDAMLVYGGVEDAQSRLTDLHRLDLVSWNWAEVRCCGHVPRAHAFHSAAVLGRLMVVVGGFDGRVRLADVTAVEWDAVAAPPSLQWLCARYIRANIVQLLRCSRLRTLPEHIAESILWNRDAYGELRGSCEHCACSLCIPMRGHGDLCLCGHACKAHIAVSAIVRGALCHEVPRAKSI